MNLRQIGNTDIHVSEVGFGAWQLGDVAGWNGPSEKESIQLVHRALDEGCNLFDSAPPYGAGESERILGKALKGRRQETVICTKFGYFPDWEVDFSSKGLMRSIEESLMRLQTDTIDILLMHSPQNQSDFQNLETYATLERLKQEGKIRAYGASIDSAEEISWLVQNTQSEVVEVLFHIFNQSPRLVFPEAKEAGVGFLAKVPLDSGWLSGKYDANSTFTGARSRWTPEQIQERAALVDKLRAIIDDQRMSLVALQFILGYDVMASVIPGVKNEAQLLGNLEASSAPLDQDVFDQLVAFWTDEMQETAVPW
jgi:aryl-alcohol dehydrogenase-like predicted oxidoreductase